MSVFNDLGTDKLLSLYRQMTLIRRFEDQVYLLYLQGEIPGTVHQYQGQEAVAVGICDHLATSDWITSPTARTATRWRKGYPHARPWPSYTAKRRAAAAAKVAQCTWATRRWDGTRHRDCRRWKFGGRRNRSGLQITANGTGCSLLLWRGATNEGAFHESLDFAAVQHLPIVFVCENNLYGASTAYSKVSLVEK